MKQSVPLIVIASFCMVFSALTAPWRLSAQEDPLINKRGKIPVLVRSIKHVENSPGMFFHFDARDLSHALGREDWDGETIWISRGEPQTKPQRAKVWKGAKNSEKAGDSHGRFEPIAHKSDWKVGETFYVASPPYLDSPKSLETSEKWSDEKKWTMGIAASLIVVFIGWFAARSWSRLSRRSKKE